MRLLLLLLFAGSFLTSFGQFTVKDSLNEAENRFHSPRKAAAFSAILPGAGQVYNKKYWKLPIIYAGLGTAGYFVYTNNQSYRLYRNALIAELDTDPETVNQTEYNTSQLNQLQETYHRWRDLSIFAFAGIYILQIIDATVDAHLFYFDVSDDLSLVILPSFPISIQNKGGLSLVLKF